MVVHLVYVMTAGRHIAAVDSKTKPTNLIVCYCLSVKYCMFDVVCASQTAGDVMTNQHVFVLIIDDYIVHSATFSFSVCMFSLLY